ncbi:tetratricopeptide repeat protein [bacterium]|nr:tetratricopeptide repeat protein [bacterium]
MFNRLKNVFNKIKDLNVSVDNYKQDSIIQSLPTVAYVNKAKKLIEEKQFEKAETLLKEALDISTQDSKVYKYLGKIYERNFDTINAIENYEKSAQLNPQDKEIWLRLGMCQLNFKQFEQAIESFEKANKVTPMNTDVYTGWGMALMRLKKYALARDKFVTASQISKYNFTAILLSAIMEIRLGDYESAETKLEFLAKVAPNESSTYEYAHLKLIKSDYKEAEKYAKKSLEINKQMLPAYFILGEIYSLQKDYEKTNKTFQSAIDNDLENETLHFEWGKACIRLFDFDCAKNHFEIALNKDSNYIDAKIGLALVKSLEGDFTLLDKLKEKNGSNVYIQEAIGLKYFSQGKYEDALEMFKKALRTDIKQTYNLLHIARCYQYLNNNEKIKEYFEKFIQENPQYKTGLLEYSKWLIKIADFADAQRKLRKVEKLDNECIEALNLLFYTSYILVKDNVCEYNVKEAISIAEKIKTLGNFEYETEKEELENILKNIQENK